MTVLMPVDSARTMDFHAKDANKCQGSPLNTIENTGNDSNDIDNMAYDDLLSLRFLPRPPTSGHLA
jgi:hypothetical protein